MSWADPLSGWVWLVLELCLVAVRIVFVSGIRGGLTVGSVIGDRMALDESADLDCTLSGGAH